MRYPIVVAFAASCLIVPVSLACIQGSHLMDVDLLQRARSGAKLKLPTRVDVKISPSDGNTSVPITEAAATEACRKKITEYEAKKPGTATPDEINDYAASLIFLKQADQAISELVSLEKSSPGLYATAANLGTAYELVGDIPNALIWIGEGIARNPQSHRGTEWLHLAILKAKLKLRDDPRWLESHSVLDTETMRDDAETLAAIEYQLNERLHFVAPKDAIVCDLFYQAALRLSGPDSEERRKWYFDESLRFGDLRTTAIRLSKEKHGA